MRGGVAKQRRTRRSRLNLPKLSQEKLLDAVASEGAEHPPSHSAQSPVSGDLTRETTPLQSDKWQPDAASDIRSLPAKRARLTRTDIQRPGVKAEKAEQATLLRKRQISSDGDDNEHQLKRARLTRKNLALFNKMARKKGTNKGSASAPPESTVESSTTKTTSTTTSGFAIQTYKNGILEPRYSKPPTNLEDIHKRLDGSRATASPPESVYEDYVDKVGGAVNEATMVFEVGGKLLKGYPKGYKRAFNQAFTGFPKDVGLNNGLSAPQPDFVEGLEMQQYEPFPVDEHVSGAVLYKDDPCSLTLSHLAGEWKGRGKDMEEARLQSAYYGAALVYARNQALSLIGKPDPPGHAEVTTFTTDGTNINFFAHYAAPSNNGTLKYHQYPLRSTNLINVHQGLKDGRRELRNEQDHAFKQSYALRDQLKEHWKQPRGALQPIAESAPLPVTDGTVGETNADEDEAGYEEVEQPCQPTPAASSSVSSSKSLPPMNDFVPGSGGQKRKASPSSQRSSHESSRQRSRGKNYWKWDGESGQYFHRHSDGRVTWLEDSDDGN